MNLIPLDLVSFACVKAERNRRQIDDPRWMQQVRAIRFNSSPVAEVCVKLMVEYNIKFTHPDLWDIFAMNIKKVGGLRCTMTGSEEVTIEVEQVLCKETKSKLFYLDCKKTLDERGNLHNDNDFAFESGGLKYCYLHGLLVEDPKWIFTPVEQIDSGQILRITNVDLRREMMRRKGLEQFLDELFHRTLDKQGNYELIQVILGNSINTFGTYLKMLNPSIGVWHMEGVPNYIRTVEEALLWRNNGWFVHADRLT